MEVIDQVGFEAGEVATSKGKSEIDQGHSTAHQAIGYSASQNAEEGAKSGDNVFNSGTKRCR